MSLQSFILKIWTQIKNLFENLPSELQYASEIGVTITQNIKEFVDSPIADIITAIIPGDIDDHIKEWLRKKLPEILAGLRLVNQQLNDPIEVTQNAVATIKSLDGNIQNAFLHDLAILIAQEVAKAQNKELSWSDGVYILQWFYQHKVKKAESGV